MAQIDTSKYDTDDDWGRKDNGPFEHVCPSGKLVLVKQVDMMDIMRLGLVDELDFMTKALSSKPAKEGEENKEEDGAGFAASILKGDNFSKLENIIDQLIVVGVRAPKIYAKPRDDAARQKGLRYVDSIGFNDKMDLFSVIFDSDGLSTFREEPEPSVADVPNVTDVPLPAL